MWQTELEYSAIIHYCSEYDQPYTLYMLKADNAFECYIFAIEIWSNPIQTASRQNCFSYSWNSFHIQQSCTETGD